MNKALLGLILGAVLGVLDGLSAWFYPEVRDQLFTSIIPGSTGKGLVAGLITGFIARKLRNLPLGIVVGTLAAALITLPISMMENPETGKAYFWEILIPGSICGAIVGFATQRYGRGAGDPVAPAGATGR